MEDNKLNNKEKNQKGLKIFTLILAFLLTVMVTANVTLYLYKNFHPSPSSKLEEIDALVREYYSGEIDRSALDEALATAYMVALEDKYGFYKNTEDTVEVSNSFEGNASGIGVTVYNDSENKALTVFRIDSGSPAASVGIKIGDKITAIDGETIAELGFVKGVEAIERELGETAELTVIRDGKTLKIEVVYEDYVKQSVYSEKIGDYGYLCFTNFNEATVEQFETALKELTAQKVKGLIFDMRGNGGGTVDSVCEILDTLVGECDLMTVVYADGTKSVTAKSDAEKTDLPMAVLTDGDTASAAELFAATIRDMTGGALIGNTTYGKGVVQRTYYLSDDSCIRFTVGEFFPAGGESFNAVGLIPDYEVTFTEEEEKNQFTLGAEDPYIKKAVEYLKD